MNLVEVPFAALRPGDKAHFSTDGAGRYGTVVDANESRALVAWGRDGAHESEVADGDYEVVEVEKALAAEECIQYEPGGDCAGPVDWHSVDPGVARAFPRCARHWSDRLRQRENSVERYANSDVAPAWFDPSYAGERWDDDY